MSAIKFTVVDNAALQFTAPNEDADVILNYVSKAAALKKSNTHTELLVNWGIDEVTFLAEGLS